MTTIFEVSAAFTFVALVSGCLLSGCLFSSCNVDDAPAAAGGPTAQAHFDHSGITTNCASCHESDRPAPNTPVPGDPGVAHMFHSDQWGGTADCSNCHGKKTGVIGDAWSNSLFPHRDSSGNKVTTCQVCHDGERPTTPEGPSGFSHTTSGQGDCAACHTFPGLTWSQAGFSHNPMPTTCSNCHEIDRPLPTVSYPTGATIDVFYHLSTVGGGGDCVQCHTAAAANVGLTWAGGNFNHTPQPVTCSICHTGNVPTVTVPNTKDGYYHQSIYGWDCVKCHTGTPANIGKTFVGGNFNHKDINGQTVNTCQPCHNTRNHAQGEECRTCHIASVPGVNWDILRLDLKQKTN